MQSAMPPREGSWFPGVERAGSFRRDVREYRACSRLTRSVLSVCQDGNSRMALRLTSQAEGSAASPRLFGTDGVRGVANVHPMTAEMVMELGRALAYLIRNGNHRHRVVIGKDTRLSGYMLEQALSAGIMSMGVDVAMVGPLPTPAIANLTTSMRADAGAVIS